MDFQQTFFEIFQLPEAYELDVDQLSAGYLELQKRIHPDNFSSATDSEKRRSLQWATHVNEAFTTLKSPLQRAIYMLGLRGLSIEHNPQLDPAFLMSQIELREELEEIGEDSSDDTDAAVARLDQFKATIQKTLKKFEAGFAENFATDLALAEQTTYKMQFMNKLLVAADQLEERLLDY
ncbi:MAG: molecular chaperone HscB [Litorivivens sp.]